MTVPREGSEGGRMTEPTFTLSMPGGFTAEPGTPLSVYFPDGSGVSARLAGVDIGPSGSEFTIHCNQHGAVGKTIRFETEGISDEAIMILTGMDAASLAAARDENLPVQVSLAHLNELHARVRVLREDIEAGTAQHSREIRGAAERMAELRQELGDSVRVQIGQKENIDRLHGNISSLTDALGARTDQVTELTELLEIERQTASSYKRTALSEKEKKETSRAASDEWARSSRTWEARCATAEGMTQQLGGELETMRQMRDDAYARIRELEKRTTATVTNFYVAATGESPNAEEMQGGVSVAQTPRWRVVVRLLPDVATGLSTTLTGRWEDGDVEAKQHAVRVSAQLDNHDAPWHTITHENGATLFHVDDVDTLTVEKEI